MEGFFLDKRFGFDLGFDRYESRRYKWEETWKRGWQEELELLRDRQSDKPLFYSYRPT